MKLTANDINRKTWLEVQKNSDFPIQNIPFGIFLCPDDIISAGTRIGDFVIDLAALHTLGYFEGIDLDHDIFKQDTLNDFISLGQKTWREVRNRISDIFLDSNTSLQNNQVDRKKVLFAIADVEMQLPVQVGDYTDFYSSREHATNVGKIFRDPENALLPNWLHIPVGYHGRSSSLITSGVPVRRPWGQVKMKDAENPVFSPTRMLDYELEMAFITSDANKREKSVDVNEAENHIFGMVLLNDWSARDIQAWEYVPLGPFLGKSFATSLSPWIVTLDALQPFKTESPEQKNPKPLPYLQTTNNEFSYDIHLEAHIKTKKGEFQRITKTNFKYMYWTMAQQLAHHTVNGCEVRSGDLMGSGTISGTTPDSYGSMLELSWRGQNPISLKNGESRSFLEDGDELKITGYAEANGIRIGFGECIGKILPANKK